MARSEPLQWDDMSRGDQRIANRIHGEHIAGLPQELNRQSHLHRARVTDGTSMKDRGNLAKAARMGEAGEAITRKTASLGQAAQNRVELVERGVREFAKPGENMPGAGWYFDAGRKAKEAAPGFPPERAIAASSALSPGTQPEVERRALGALAQAQESGQVTHRGRMVPFSEVPSKDVPGIIKNRPPAENIDYGALGGPQSQQFAKATGILRGEVTEPQDPVANPKTWSYTNALRGAAEAVHTPVEGEYQHRMGVLGDKIAGRVGVGQGSLDLYGLQGSNEGMLSNRQHTAEDTWMQSVTNRHLISDEATRRTHIKGTADVSIGKKTDSAGNSPGGRGNTDVSPAGIQHAWNNRATTMAAEQLQEKYQTEFTIPSVGVQETAWTAVRRDSAQASTKPGASADREYNAHLAAERAASTPPKPPTKRQAPTLF